jgi:hypothetical protein
MTEQFAVRASGWDSLPTSTAAWDEGRARAALDAWAGDNMSKYAQGFLWVGGDPQLKTSYKFPVAMPVNGKLTVFRNAVNNAKARLNQASVPSADKAKMATILNRLSGSYEEMSLVAGGAPLNPPKAWFTNPQLSGPTKVTVTPDGRVFGHLALFGSCHLTFANTCVTVPRSNRGYADFHAGSTRTAEGKVIDTGVLTVDTGHADTSWGLADQVKAHYDNTGTAAAVVRAGEDAYGVWVAGALVPGADEELAQKLRRSPLSGDWRRIGGGLELVAALGVNRPGYQITASGEEQFLIYDSGEGISDFDIDNDFAFIEEDGEIMCLIAALGPGQEFGETQDDDEEDETYDGELVEQAAAEPGCGCPDVANAFKERAPLPTLAERTALSQRFASLTRL